MDGRELCCDAEAEEEVEVEGRMSKRGEQTHLDL